MSAQITREQLRAALEAAIATGSRVTAVDSEERMQALHDKARELVATVTEVRIGSSGPPPPGCLYRQATEALGLDIDSGVTNDEAIGGIALDDELRRYRERSLGLGSLFFTVLEVIE